MNQKAQQWARNPKIQRLARENPIVERCVAMWQRDIFTWDEMLISCIAHLVEVNQKLADDLLTSRRYVIVINKQEGHVE